MDWTPTDEQMEELGHKPLDGETSLDELEPGRSWAEFFTNPTGTTCTCQQMSTNVFDCEAHGEMLRKSSEQWRAQMGLSA